VAGGVEAGTKRGVPITMTMIVTHGWDRWHCFLNLTSPVRFQVLAAASMKMAVFWVVAPCSLVEDYRRFRGVCCLLLIALMMEAVSTSEMSVNFYQTIRRYNPEDSHLRTHRRENLKSYRS
jgi:hypothetical protein